MVKVGDRVRLSKEGFETINGLKSWDEVVGATEMVVLEVDPSIGDGSFASIEVSGPLGVYMLTDHDVEVIGD